MEFFKVPIDIFLNALGEDIFPSFKYYRRRSCQSTPEYFLSLGKSPTVTKKSNNP